MAEENYKDYIKNSTNEVLKEHYSDITEYYNDKNSLVKYSDIALNDFEGFKTATKQYYQELKAEYDPARKEIDYLRGKEEHNTEEEKARIKDLEEICDKVSPSISKINYHFVNVQQTHDIYTVMKDDDFDLYKLNACFANSFDITVDLLEEDKELYAKVEKLFANPRTLLEQENIQETLNEKLKFSTMKDGINILQYNEEKRKKFNKLFNLDEIIEQSYQNLRGLSGGEVVDVFKGTEESRDKKEQAEALSWVLDTYYENINNRKHLNRDLYHTKFNKDVFWKDLPKLFNKIENLDIDSKLGKFYQDRVGAIANLSVVSSVVNPHNKGFYNQSNVPFLQMLSRTKDLIKKDKSNPYIEYYVSQISLINRYQNDDYITNFYKLLHKTYKDTKPQLVDDFAAKFEKNYGLLGLMELYNQAPTKSLLPAIEDKVYDEDGATYIGCYNKADEFENEDLTKAICNTVKKNAKELTISKENNVYFGIDYNPFCQAIKEADVTKITIASSLLKSMRQSLITDNKKITTYNDYYNPSEDLENILKNCSN